MKNLRTGRLNSGWKKTHRIPLTPRPAFDFVFPGDATLSWRSPIIGTRLCAFWSTPRSQPVATPLIWDAIDHYGQRIASGNYTYRLEANGFMAIRKLEIINLRKKTSAIGKD